MCEKLQSGQISPKHDLLEQETVAASIGITFSRTECFSLNLKPKRNVFLPRPHNECRAVC